MSARAIRYVAWAKMQCKLVLVLSPQLVNQLFSNHMFASTNRTHSCHSLCSNILFLDLWFLCRVLPSDMSSWWSKDSYGPYDWTDRSTDWYSSKSWSAPEDAALPVQKHQPQVPSSFAPDAQHFDKNGQPPLLRTIAPTQWSRKNALAGVPIDQVTVAQLCRKGLEEHQLRNLSQGKFTGCILTRSIPETVFAARLMSAIRAQGIDIDKTITSLFQSKALPVPDKTKNANDFIQPLIDLCMDKINPIAQHYQPATDHRSAPENARIQELEKLVHRYEQKGVALTPERPNTPNPGQPSKVDAPEEPPAKKRRQNLELDQVLEPKQQIPIHVRPAKPDAANLKTWQTSLREQLTNRQAKTWDGHFERVSKLIQGVSKADLKTAAIKWGLSFAEVSTMSPKNLTVFLQLATWVSLHHVDQLIESSDSQIQLRAFCRSTLGTLLSFVLWASFSLSFVNKELLLWLQGLLTIALVTYASYPTIRTKQFARMLQRFELSIHSYTWSFFTQPCCVYVKVPVHNMPRKLQIENKHWYIGSTSLTLSKREWNRQAKIRQCQQGLHAKYEPAVRFWSCKDNYHEFATVKLVQCTDYRQAWNFEHQLIGIFQPLLNAPFVNRLLRTTATHIDMNKKSRHIPVNHMGKRLLRRVRLMLQAKFTNCNVRALTLHRGFDLLWQSAQTNRWQFEAQKTLRSNMLDNIELYAIWRLTNHLEQPYRSICRNQLKSAFDFRNLVVPKENKPLHIPALADPDFASEARRFLKRFISDNRFSAIPLHLPSATVRAYSVHSLERLLWNHKQMRQDCTCAQLSRQFPGLPLAGGHFWADAVTLAKYLPKDLAYFLPFSCKTPVFPGFHDFQRHIAKNIRSWLRHHSFPEHLETAFHVLITTLWGKHLQCLRSRRPCPLHFRRVHFLKETFLKHFTVHCQDHQASHLTFFCPRLYFESSYRTWRDPEVFGVSPHANEVHRQLLLQAVPKSFWQKYPWGIDKNASLPYGYVLLKAKKQFLSGRTIVAYKGSMLAKLLTGTAIALKLILQTTWPESLGLASTPVMWQDIKKLFVEADDTIELNFWNDDLVGFFNSIPQDRLLDMVQTIILEYLESYPHQTLMVDIYSSKKLLRSHTGFSRHSVASNLKAIHIADIQDIVALSFRCSAFSAINKIFLQKRGTCMGNQISPVLSEVAVAAVEVAWSKTWRAQMNSDSLLFKCWRYVDNRVVIFSSECQELPAAQQFFSTFFYGAPVQLEVVDDNHFLGFDVLPSQREIRYLQPQHAWQIRCPHAACTQDLLYSGFCSRLSLIYKHTHPRELARDAALSLGNFFIRHGYDRCEILKLVERAERKYAHRWD